MLFIAALAHLSPASRLLAGCRASWDLEGAERTLCQLRAWHTELEAMPLSQTAGLLSLDAAPLQQALLPLVSTASRQQTGLLLELAGERCRGVLSEMKRWEEVGAARPPDLESGFLPWSAELARMRGGLGNQLAAAREVNAALGLVAAHAGKLPTAEAVKLDDLGEAARTRSRRRRRGTRSSGPCTWHAWSSRRRRWRRSASTCRPG